jgi:putative aminopeptidase FrvX
MKQRLRSDLTELMLIPGLSGHESRMRHAIKAKLDALGIATRADVMGNLTASFPGIGPSVMLFAHMDQLGFVVRKVEADGGIRVERLGGVPERALASQSVVLSTASGDLPGLIANKSHHATTQDEKYQVLRAPELRIDTGHTSKAQAEAAGIVIGTPVTYAPKVIELPNERIAGTAIDDRAGCTVLLECARALASRKDGPPVHLVWSVQEEFNLRGAQVAAQTLRPDIAIQIDLMLASDTPEMADRGDMALGGGPGMSLYSFHGRGTLNGVIPHPALVDLFETTARTTEIPLQRSAQTGILTDLSYVQLVGSGVASLDIGFPMRYSHSSLEMCDLNDLEQLTQLILAALPGITTKFPLIRN